MRQKRRWCALIAAVACASGALAQCPGRWEQPPPLPDAGVVTALGALPDNRLLVGRLIGATPQILMLDESGWTLLGTVRGDEPGRIYLPSTNAFLQLPAGDIIVGGWFTSINGVDANCVARWDGTEWSPLGTGLLTVQFPHRWPGVHSFLELPEGEILAGGLFDIPGSGANQNFARWDGQAWGSMGASIEHARYATALVRSAAGELFAGGTFTVRRYDDPEWVPIGDLVLQGISKLPEMGAPLAVLNNDDLIVGNISTVGDLDVNGIARWDGAEWHTLGSGFEAPGGGDFLFVTALSVLRNGRLVAAGGNIGRAGGVEVSSIAQWDGSSWSALGSGIGGGLAFVTTVLPNGDLYVGGNYTRAGEHAVAHLARWTTRPACAVDYDCNSVVTSADFFAFLTLFFVHAPEADLDGDGTTDIADFFEFIESFFAGCG